jgi:hypothetical protein
MCSEVQLTGAGQIGPKSKYKVGQIDAVVEDKLACTACAWTVTVR